MLDCQLFGLRPRGHHFHNILLHGLNAVLLFLLLWKGTRRIWLSAAVAALFALHPLNVESVAWVAERKNVLSTFFLFLTLAAYGWYAQKPGWRRYLTLLGAFVLGLASKPMLVSLPFALLLIDYWPLGRRDRSQDASRLARVSRRGLILEKIPLLLLAALSSMVTIVAQRAGGAIRNMQVLPLHLRIENAVVSYALYVKKMFWPARLAVFYVYNLHPNPFVVAGAAIFIAAGTAAAIRFRSHRYLAAGWFWFLGTMFPVIGLVQVGDQAMADRYAYVPLLGLFVIVVWGAGELTGQFNARFTATTIFAVALVALSLTARHQISYWQNSLTLWTRDLEVAPATSIAHDNLAEALEETGREQEALAHLRAALALRPRDPLAHFDLGSYYLTHHEIAKGVAEYQTVSLNTQDPLLLATAHTNAGLEYASGGDFALAKVHFQEAIRLNSESYKAHAGYGLLLFNQGNSDAAIAEFQKSIAIVPNVIANFNLGRAYEMEGKYQQALAAYEQLMRLDPEIAGLQQKIAEVTKRSKVADGSR
jgi:tetratricopeptide (TPR) repeat protein